MIINYDNEKLNDLNFGEYNIFWFRRGAFQYKLQLNNKSSFLRKYLELEYKHIHESIYKIYNFDLSFNAEYLNNKITNLNLAKDLGFKIPNTLITTKKNDVTNFLKLHKKVITKPINNFHPNGEINKSTKIISLGTVLLNSENLNSISESFCPSLVQEYIEKSYEVRVYVYDTMVYSMAIFSQSRE